MVARRLDAGHCRRGRTRQLRRATRGRRSTCTSCPPEPSARSARRWAPLRSPGRRTAGASPMPGAGAGLASEAAYDSLGGLRVLDVDSGQQEVLGGADHGFHGAGPVWSPDGETIVYQRLGGHGRRAARGRPGEGRRPIRADRARRGSRDTPRGDDCRRIEPGAVALARHLVARRYVPAVRGVDEFDRGLRKDAGRRGSDRYGRASRGSRRGEWHRRL